jgi:hypothetical protein
MQAMMTSFIYQILQMTAEVAPRDRFRFGGYSSM